MEERNNAPDPRTPNQNEYGGNAQRPLRNGSDNLSGSSPNVRPNIPSNVTPGASPNASPNASYVRRRPDEFPDLNVSRKSAEVTANLSDAPSVTEPQMRNRPERAGSPATPDATCTFSAQSADGLDGATRISAIATKVSEEKGSSRGKKDKKTKGGRKQSESGNSVMSVIKCIAYITGVFVAAVLLSVVVIIAANDVYAFVKPEGKVEIEIPEGAGIDELAEILADNRVVNYEFLFKTYAKIKNKDEGILAGTYTISPTMNYDALLAEFKEKPQTGVQWVTIPEGYTVDEIIDLLVNKHGIGDRERYIEVINEYDFDYWFIDELGDDWAADGRLYRLEGYLFPDSYQFYSNSSEETVIGKMLTRFNQVFTKNYRERAQVMGYSVDEILTLASIIEKEAGKQSEFNRVSSVFHNRLNSPNFVFLESDATVMYIIQHETGSRPVLTGEDMEYDTPYNTYKYPGLTPGPIANPSNSAILAAMNPENTDYYFFVSYQNETTFSRTKEEHDAAVQEINEKRQQAAAENSRTD